MGELHKTYICKNACLLQISSLTGQVCKYKPMLADVAPDYHAVWKLLEVS